MQRDDEKIDQVLKEIGKLLREARKEKGYTNYETFAFFNGITRGRYFEYEKGANMNLDTLIHILASLNMPIGKFFEPLDEMIETLYPERKAP